MRNKAQAGNFNKCIRILTALSEANNALSSFPKEAKERCIRLIPLCHEGIMQKKMDSQLIFKVLEQFAKCGIFQSDKLKEDVVCIGKEKERISINKHLLLINSPTTIFEPSQSEIEESAVGEIQCPEIPSHVLSSFKHYIYHRVLQKDLSLKDLMTLHQLANLYVMKELYQ